MYDHGYAFAQGQFDRQWPPDDLFTDKRIPKEIEDFDADELCEYCPLPDESKGTHGVPSGYTSCEGCCCEQAYERYLEDFESEEDDEHISKDS